MPNRSLAVAASACLLGFWGLSCTSSRNPCLEPTVPRLKVASYQFRGNAVVDTVLPNVIFASLDIDSARFLYWGAKSVSKFDLVLSPLRDTSRWILQADSSFSPIDTLTFIYEPKLKFYSNACGYGYDFELLDVRYTKNNLDSVALKVRSVNTKANNENVAIYF